VTANINASASCEELPRIVAVSFHPAGRLCNYLAGPLALRRGDRVLVEGDAGMCIATVAIEPHQPVLTLNLEALKPIIRPADENDFRVEEETLAREAEARALCLRRIRARNLPMKLVSADLTYDGRKAVFYFTSESRVDFRDLVRDLANTLRLRVEMKQIGARDETKVTGGVGPCGRDLCCSSWLREFEAVTVKMAREQALALNPSRLAGMCGRLKCCLRYEYATYVELKRGLPPVGKWAQSVKGDGKVLRHNILKQTVLIQRDEDGGVVEAALGDLVARQGAKP
jgi:cell fate regulator YaaT (PSP1 superfamily)